MWRHCERQTRRVAGSEKREEVVKERLEDVAEKRRENCRRQSLDLVEKLVGQLESSSTQGANHQCEVCWDLLKLEMGCSSYYSYSLIEKMMNSDFVWLLKNK